ncbi:uncharacterized protein LOC121422784 [Lytechinus variegatus]|uniref:uncharacterized protein LOC121422784 n=1 Tax=Lytechinus variegatus TaxID=7654 RepID=UPI001BB281F8|nr:uncharacterized protein LOC121422784 [Lytechinus variegatus]
MAAPIDQKTLTHGSRLFYTFPKENNQSVETLHRKNENVFLKYIRDNVIGHDSTFSGPFGPRKVTYSDYTASGKSLGFIEDYIRANVLPTYGNTHTTTSVTSLQSTLFRHEARDIVRNAVNASEHDAVIFTGTGCTAAIHKLVNALHLTDPPVVFVGPYEHHSNLLPWRETGAEIIRIPEDADGLADTRILDSLLQTWRSTGRQLIGCFSAASNVTGILVDTVAITTILHRHNALAFWDYATAGPYVEIDMNPVVAGILPSLTSKDAIFLSPHKFVGGVETPGILVSKKALFVNPNPTGGGGGSVFFVRREAHRYLKQIEMREEGGTPSIVGAIRAGLVMQLKETIGHEMIMRREKEIWRSVLERFSSCPNLVILGSTSQPRLPIISFLIRHPHTKQFLHHNFICALLNDVYGIQARGGCACAGPYAQDLLGIDEDLAEQFEDMLLEDSRLDRVHLRRYSEYSEKEILRPGFARLNFPFFMSEEEKDFVMEAVAMVAENGWKLLPQYMFNPETGEWKHQRHQVFEDRRWLGSISYTSGHMTYPEPRVVKKKGSLPNDYQHCLQLAEELFVKAAKTQIHHLPDQTILFDEGTTKLRWFMLPSEANKVLKGNRKTIQASTLPFEPPSYPLTEGELGKRREHLQRCQPSVTSTKIHDRVKGQRSVSGSSYEDGLEQNDKDVVLGQKPGEDDTLDDGKNVHQRSSNAQRFVDSVIEGFGGSCDASSISPDTSHDTSPGSSESHTHCVILQEESENKGSGDMVADICERMPRFSKGNNDVPDILGESSLSDQDRLMQSGCENTLCSVNDDTLDQDGSVLPRTKENDGIVNKDATLEFSLQKENSSSNTNSDGCLPCQQQSRAPQCDNAQGLQDDVSIDSDVCQKLQTPPKTESSHDSKGEPAVKFKVPPKKIFKPTLQALEDYKMLRDGDRVLVCLSGGKDSLSLLHTLRQYQFAAKKNGITFDLGAVTVDPQTASFNPRPLIGYLAKLGLPYFYEEQCIIDQAAALPEGCDSICSFCSRMKRGRLYACARREGYNVLAMGQHLDDLTESFLMSVFHNGLLRTMKANYTVKEGDLRVIRPFVYVREKDLRDFAEQAKLPVIPENCPACFEAPKERHRVKQLLAAQELLFPRLYPSLQTALRPLMSKNKTGMESTLAKMKHDEDDIDF